jgi:hypothetical protein
VSLGNRNTALQLLELYFPCLAPLLFRVSRLRHRRFPRSRFGLSGCFFYGTHLLRMHLLQSQFMFLPSVLIVQDTPIVGSPNLSTKLSTQTPVFVL